MRHQRHMILLRHMSLRSSYCCGTDGDDDRSRKLLPVHNHNWARQLHNSRRRFRRKRGRAIRTRSRWTQQPKLGQLPTLVALLWISLRGLLTTDFAIPRTRIHPISPRPQNHLGFIGGSKDDTAGDQQLADVMGRYRPFIPPFFTGLSKTLI